MKIFVGNVDGADTTPEELAALFAPYGTVMSCAVMKQFAFVHMRENAGAVRAIEALHGHELRPGRALVVEMSRPRPLNTWKIFVGNVSAACTSQELRSLFERRGRVIECDVVKGNAGARSGRGSARCTQPINHAPYPGGWSLRLGTVGKCAGAGPKVLGGELGNATLPCGPGNNIHQVGEVGSGRVQWPLLGEAAGLGSRQRLASVPGWGRGAFSWLQGLGTKLKLGSDGHQPDHGAGKISPLPHFLYTHRSDPGKREKVGAKAPRPPRGFLLTNAPKWKVTGPLVVSRVAVFISIVCHGSACGYQRGLFQTHLAFQYLVGYP